MKFKYLFLVLSVFILFVFTATAQTIVTSSTTTMTSGTYQVTEDVTISARITVSGDVTLLLGEGATLNATAGIQVQQGNTLTIDGKGSLIATAGSNGHAGIGGDGYGGKGGNIIINGGTITATGNKASNGGGGAGIGAGYGDNSGNYKSTFGNITITGGTITANGAYGAAGIGAGDDYSTCGNILICGGTVNATGGYWGAGIGTGSGFNAGTLSSICGSITITGGNITATKGVDPKSSSYTYTNKFYSIGAGNNGSCGTVTIGGADGAIKTSPYTINIVPATYVVSFNANGGKGSMSNQTFNIDFAKPLTRNTFTRDGYFFTGWSNSADGDVDYVNGQTVTNLASANGTKTLYAKWMSANELPEGMQVDADYRENETGFYYVNMPINNTTTIVKVNDFKFFPFKIYDDGGKDNNATKGESGYLTIYPPTGYNVNLTGKVLATKSQYHATLTIYDGSNTNAKQMGEFNYSNNISISSTGSSITLHFYGSNNSDVEGLGLTATTSIIEYGITYSGIEDATFSTANPSSYTVESDEITLAQPTREGYTFLGWTYDGQTEPIKNVTIPKGSTGNKEFVANWQQKLGALTLVYAGNRTTATLQGEFTSTETTSLNLENQIEVNELTFQRTFKAGVPATIMLPFDFIPDDNVGKFYTLQSVEHENGVWTAKMSQPITGIIQANTPYIFMPTNDITPSNYMTFRNITLKPTIINDNGSGDWTLHGVYEKTQLDGFNQVNYGFAGQATDDGISVGQFIRAGEGVWADPMRCYLTYKKGELTKAATVLPDRIRVVFPDEVEQSDNGEIVTPVLEISSESGVKVWSFDGTVYIEAQPDMDYIIVDLTGRTIKQGVTHSTHEELNLNTKGIVIVKIGNKTFKLK